MTATRTPWTRMSVDEVCAELHRLGIRRKISKDSPIECKVCEEAPEAGEWVYYPSEHPNSQTNTIIGHESCVKSHLAKLKKAAAAQQVDTTVIHLPAAASAKPTAIAKADGALTTHSYYLGWMLGAKFAFGSQPDLSELIDDEARRGFSEGMAFGMQHKHAN